MSTLCYRACAGLLIMLLAACSSQAVYPTVQVVARQRCLQLPPSQQADCLARLNQDDHDTYHKKRTAP